MSSEVYIAKSDYLIYGDHTELVKGYIVQIGALKYKKLSPLMRDTPYYQYQVRIPCYHNNVTWLDDNELPWAISSYPEPPLLGNPNIDPPSYYSEGDVVYILFEGGDIRYPIIIGKIWDRMTSDQDGSYATFNYGVSPLNGAYSNDVGYYPSSTNPGCKTKTGGKSSITNPPTVHSSTNPTPVPPTVFDGDHYIGCIVCKYESGKNSTAIGRNSGDAGGASYGKFQFASATGALDSFLKYLATVKPDYATQLTNAKSKDGGTYGSNFDQAWISVASNQDFSQYEYGYVQNTYYYGPAQSLLNATGFDADSHGNAVKEAFFSTTLQMGGSGGKRIWSKYDLSTKSDKEIVDLIYEDRINNVNSYLRSCSQSIRNSWVNRAKREWSDVLGLIK